MNEDCTHAWYPADIEVSLMMEESEPYQYKEKSFLFWSKWKTSSGWVGVQRERVRFGCTLCGSIRVGEWQ